jgi:HD-GYP domain-containing protein (c-di-GMP phosphodiesterase class II)
VPASAVRKLNAAGQQLAVLLPLIEHGTAPQDVLARLETVAGLVAKAVAVDADVAVAAILHNQQDLPYSIRHSLNSAIIVHLLGQARQLAQPEVRSLTLAALTMNVGMLAQHQRLQDCSEELCSSDRAMVLHHCERSVELLRAAGIDDARWLECVLHHHENEDGSGYPLRKAGAQIPPLARLLALADRYCARVSERAYRKTMAPNLALRDLLLDANVTVDGNLAPMLIRALGIYPVGTYVRLLNGKWRWWHGAACNRPRRRWKPCCARAAPAGTQPAARYAQRRARHPRCAHHGSGGGPASAAAAHGTGVGRARPPDQFSSVSSRPCSAISRSTRMVSRSAAW